MKRPRPMTVEWFLGRRKKPKSKVKVTTVWLVVKKDREFHPTDLQTHKNHATKKEAMAAWEWINGAARHLWKVTKVVTRQSSNVSISIYS